MTIGGFTNAELDMGSSSYILLPSLAVTDNATAALSGATLTITVGRCVSGCVVTNLLQGDAGSGMLYVPALTLKDAATNRAAGSFHTTDALL